MRFWPVVAAAAAAVSVADGAAARCVLEQHVARDAMEAAKFLHRGEDIIVDGIVRELPRGDDTLFQRVEIVQYLKGEGPLAIDIWPGPARRQKHDILNADDWGRIDAPDGARVVTALKATPFGWTVSECAYQALAVPGVEDALRNGRWVTAESGRTGE